MSGKIPKWRNLTEEEIATLKKHHGTPNLVKVGEKEWTLPEAWLKYGEQIVSMEAKKDDTWVVTYPRSGTTLTQELVWLISNNFDFDTANSIPFLKRFPFLEYTLLLETRDENVDPKMHDKFQGMITSVKIENITKMPSPRFIKTHLSFELLPHVLDSGCKIVYVARNPKDAMVSWYYFEKSFGKSFKGTLEDSWQHLKNNLRVFSPYWTHIKEGWAEKHRANVLFLFYEDIVRDLPKAIKTIGDFLEKPYTEEQVAKLTEHLNIENFRANKMINPQELREAGIIPKSYIRKGVVGGSKGHFTPELEAEVDEWIRENLEGTDIVFPV